MSIMLRQDKYILDIIHQAGMFSCKLVDTPIFAFKLDMVSDYMFSDPTWFRQIIDAL
jgi:hypothetical protein